MLSQLSRERVFCPALWLSCIEQLAPGAGAPELTHPVSWPHGDSRSAARAVLPTFLWSFIVAKGLVCLLGPVLDEVLSHTQCKVLFAGATWNHLLSVSWDEAHPRVVLDCVNDSCLEQTWVLKIPESVSGRIIRSAF